MSSVVATTTARYVHGNVLAFDVPFYQMVNPMEIGFYIVLGLLTGIVALLFILTLDRFEAFFEQKVKVHPWFKPALGGLILGFIGLVFPQIFGNGYGKLKEETFRIAHMGDITLADVKELTAWIDEQIGP